MLQFMMDNLDGSLSIFKMDPVLIYSVLGVILALALGLYVLRSIAVFTLAKRSDEFKKIAYMAWIPFLWIYPTAKLAGKVLFFGKPFKNFAVVLTILFIVNEVLMVGYSVLCYFPLVGYYLQGVTVTIYTGMEATRTQLMEFGYHPYYFDSSLTVLTGGGGANIVYPIANLELYGKILTVIGLASDLLSLATLLFTIFLYVSLFRRYFPKHFVIATVLSVLWSWLFPIFLFVIRKNKPVNYNDFLRERYNRMYYGQYNNPVNNGNPNFGSQPESPFEGFENKDKEDPGDPFDEN
jgi:hypothetical protein